MSNDDFKAILKEALAEQSADFDDKLKTGLAEQSAQFDAKLDARFAEYDAKLDARFAEYDAKLDTRFAEFGGQLFRYVDKRIDDVQVDMAQRFDRLETLIDGIAKRVDDDDQERAAMSQQLDRHERWIHQVADTTNTTLVTE